MNADEATIFRERRSYHMEEIAHGLRNAELSADDASILLDEEARIARRDIDAYAIASGQEQADA